MTKSEIKSICVLEFNGKTSDWEGWSEKFKARAKRKGYKDLLLGKKNIPTNSVNISKHLPLVLRRLQAKKRKFLRN
jgi:hypothetical protein